MRRTHLRASARRIFEQPWFISPCPDDPKCFRPAAAHAMSGVTQFHHPADERSFAVNVRNTRSCWLSRSASPISKDGKATTEKRGILGSAALGDSPGTNVMMKGLKIHNVSIPGLNLSLWPVTRFSSGINNNRWDGRLIARFDPIHRCGSNQ
jgi:hypothetical protein